jgi:hypothetical protein
MKHLTRKRKMNKKIVITNRHRRHKCRCPKVQSMEDYLKNILIEWRKI